MDADLPSAWGPIQFDRESRVVLYQGVRLKFSSYFAAAGVLFTMLENPGGVIGEESLQRRRSSHYAYLRSLIRIFRDVDPSFNLIRTEWGRGHYLAQDDTDPRQLYGPYQYKDLTLRWLDEELDVSGEGTLKLSNVTNEILRVLILAQGRAVSLSDLGKALYPGLNTGVSSPELSRVRRELKASRRVAIAKSNDDKAVALVVTPPPAR